MKQILKRSIIPIFLSIICGFICGKIVYKIYLGNSDIAYDGKLIYLIQSGAYSSYDNMRANTIGYNYVYYEEDDLFKTIIGITKNEENIEKIKNTYGKEVIINKYYINDQKLNNKIIEYDKKLLKETEEEQIKKIIIEMLNLYKGEEDTTLIKISWFIKNNWQIRIFNIKLYT